MIAGLGPLTHPYLVIATPDHVRCMADATASDRELVLEIEAIRAWIVRAFGPVLLTEHGRVPVCDTDTEHDEHCYHAHLLAFQTDRSIDPLLQSYFRRRMTLSSLGAAMGAAGAVDSYILSSPAATEAHVYSEPLNLPRQLTRALVAHSLGAPELADWRARPDYDAAAGTAAELRSIFEEEFGRGG